MFIIFINDLHNSRNSLHYITINLLYQYQFNHTTNVLLLDSTQSSIKEELKKARIKLKFITSMIAKNEFY